MTPDRPSIRLALPNAFRELESSLPPDVEIVWYSDGSDCPSIMAGVDVLWLDMWRPEEITAALTAGNQLQWVFCADAGVDSFPLDVFRQRNVRLTNGRGLNAPPMAEYVVLIVLAISKGFAALVLAQARHEWLSPPPQSTELAGTKALIIGYGATGRAIASHLSGLGVEVIGVRRQPTTDEPNVIGPLDWQSRLGEFDWIILSTPLTAQTRHLIGAAELARMKATAWVFNIARGAVIDQPALEAVLLTRKIGGAYLDLTSPEPLPPDSILWELPNVIVSPHSSAESDRFMRRATDLFLDNLSRYREGRPLRNQVNLHEGY